MPECSNRGNASYFPSFTFVSLIGLPMYPCLPRFRADPSAKSIRVRIFLNYCSDNNNPPFPGIISKVIDPFPSLLHHGMVHLPPDGAVLPF